MELENIILSEVRQAQKAKHRMFYLMRIYRPKTNAVTLLDMGHTLRGEPHRRNRENLNVVDVLTVEKQI
jgi:hypothetical protein